MKTKEEILEHLKTTSYNCVGDICGWLRAKKVINTDERAYFYTTSVGGHTFDDFLAWVNQEEKKEDKGFKIGDTMDGSFKVISLNAICESQSFLDEYISLLRHAFKAEPACKANYIVLYNNTEYEIIADKVEAMSPYGIVFYKGEEKVAYFPVNTPWIKI